MLSTREGGREREREEGKNREREREREREAAEQGLIADELDIDHGMVVPSETNVEQQVAEEAR